MKNTAKEEGYTFVKWLGNGMAVFHEENGHDEIWASNPNHASFGFHYNNTDWEFCSTYHGDILDKEKVRKIKAVHALAKMAW